jgi:uncharacterized protein (TIGR02266 family)
MASTGGRSPTAAGSLHKTPLVHLLVHMADQAITGSVVFASPRPNGTEENVVYFQQGAPAKARTGRPVAHLGEVLVELGAITETVNRLTVDAAMKASELHGQLLVRTGAIDPAVLMQALREQTARKMAHIFGVPGETTFSFFEDANLLDDWGGSELTVLDPLEQIWRAACARSQERVVDATLARLGSTKLKLHDESAVDRFGFAPSKLRLIECMRAGPATLEELVASGVAPERVVRLVVYALLVTRHLDRGVPGGPVGISTPPAAVVPAAGPASSRRTGESRRPSHGPNGGDRSNLREHPRYEIELDVGLECESNFYVGLTETISEGGLFIATHQLRPVGTTVEVSLTLPDSRHTIRSTATVRWARDYSEDNDAPPCMGVRFEKVDPEHVRAIKAFLARRAPIFYDDD